MNISKFKDALMSLLGDADDIYNYPELENIFIISNDDALRLIRTMVMKYGFFEFIEGINEVFMRHAIRFDETLIEASYLSEIDEHGYTHIHGLHIEDNLTDVKVTFDMGDIIVHEYPKNSYYHVVDGIVLGERATDTNPKYHRVYVED